MAKEKPLLGQGARKATTMRLPDELHARLKQEAARLARCEEPHCCDSLGAFSKCFSRINSISLITERLFSLADAFTKEYRSCGIRNVKRAFSSAIFGTTFQHYFNTFSVLMAIAPIDTYRVLLYNITKEVINGERNEIHIALGERAGCLVERKSRTTGLHQERTHRSSVVGLCGEARREGEVGVVKALRERLERR